MFQIIRLCGASALSIGVAGCVPTGVIPSVNDQITAAEAAGFKTGSQATGSPVNNSERCKSAAAILANPASIPVQRDAAQGALSAYNC